jgi:hypothetical protein
MSSIRRVVYELMPGSVIGTDEQARAGTTTQFKKGPARGRPFVGRAEARSATASSAPSILQGAISANQEPFFFFFFDGMMNILQVWTG